MLSSLISTPSDGSSTKVTDSTTLTTPLPSFSSRSSSSHNINNNSNNDTHSGSSFLILPLHHPCPFCFVQEGTSFMFTDFHDSLSHLFSRHGYTIWHVEQVSWVLIEYLQFYSNPSPSTTPFLTSMHLKGPLPCPILGDPYMYPFDLKLRQELRHQKLTEFLNQQQKELYTPFNQFLKDPEVSVMSSCFFCKSKLNTFAEILQHMFLEHSFNLGRPENLVHVKDLFTLLHQEINLFHCLYCCKTFKDARTLRTHMRKKNHIKIASTNCMYDRFYLINYVSNEPNSQNPSCSSTSLHPKSTSPKTYFTKNENEMNLAHQHIHSGPKSCMEEEEEENEEEEESWSDWVQQEDMDLDLDVNHDKSFNDPTASPSSSSSSFLVPCLFCNVPFPTLSQCLDHLHQVHQFDLTHFVYHSCNDHQAIQLINYFRFQSQQMTHLPTGAVCFAPLSFCQFQNKPLSFPSSSMDDTKEQLTTYPLTTTHLEEPKEEASFLSSHDACWKQYLETQLSYFNLSSTLNSNPTETSILSNTLDQLHLTSSCSTTQTTEEEACCKFSDIESKTLSCHHKVSFHAPWNAMEVERKWCFEDPQFLLPMLDSDPFIFYVLQHTKENEE